MSGGWAAPYHNPPASSRDTCSPVSQACPSCTFILYTSLPVNASSFHTSDTQPAKHKEDAICCPSRPSHHPQQPGRINSLRRHHGSDALSNKVRRRRDADGRESLTSNFPIPSLPLTPPGPVIPALPPLRRPGHLRHRHPPRLLPPVPRPHHLSPHELVHLTHIPPHRHRGPLPLPLHHALHNLHGQRARRPRLADRHGPHGTVHLPHRRLCPYSRRESILHQQRRGRGFRRGPPGRGGNRRRQGATTEHP